MHALAYSLVYPLMVAGLTFYITQTEMGAWVRKLLSVPRFGMYHEGMETPLERMLGCSFCTGFWVGLLVPIPVVFWPNGPTTPFGWYATVMAAIAFPFAGAMAAYVLDKLTEGMEALTAAAALVQVDDEPAERDYASAYPPRETTAHHREEIAKALAGGDPLFDSETGELNLPEDDGEVDENGRPKGFLSGIAWDMEQKEKAAKHLDAIAGLDPLPDNINRLALERYNMLPIRLAHKLVREGEKERALALFDELMVAIEQAVAEEKADGEERVVGIHAYSDKHGKEHSVLDALTPPGPWHLPPRASENGLSDIGRASMQGLPLEDGGECLLDSPGGDADPGDSPLNRVMRGSDVFDPSCTDVEQTVANTCLVEHPESTPEIPRFPEPREGIDGLTWDRCPPLPSTSRECWVDHPEHKPELPRFYGTDYPAWVPVSRAGPGNTVTDDTIVTEVPDVG